jgi:hypothetical protein
MQFVKGRFKSPAVFHAPLLYPAKKKLFLLYTVDFISAHAGLKIFRAEHGRTFSDPVEIPPCFPRAHGERPDEVEMLYLCIALSAVSCQKRVVRIEKRRIRRRMDSFPAWASAAVHCAALF